MKTSDQLMWDGKNCLHILWRRMHVFRVNAFFRWPLSKIFSQLLFDFFIFGPLSVKIKCKCHRCLDRGAVGWVILILSCRKVCSNLYFTGAIFPEHTDGSFVLAQRGKPGSH